MKFDSLVRVYLDAVMESQKDPKLAAILHGTLKLYETNYKIINTKLTKMCPMLASEAYTMVNDIAEKVMEDMENEADTTTISAN